MTLSQKDRERGFDEKIEIVLRTLRKVDDELSRLALADLLEEQCPSITQRTTSPLRNGEMVADELTLQAISLLLKLNAIGEANSVVSLLMGIHLQRGRPITLSPSEFIEVWQLVWRYRRAIATEYGENIEPGKSVLEEARLTHEMKLEKIE